MLTLAALAHFDLPFLPQNLRAADALKRFGPEGLAWVEAGGLPVGVLTWPMALAQPHALSAQLAQPLSAGLASPQSSAQSLMARNRRLGPAHWRLYRGAQLAGLVWGPDVDLWAEVDAGSLETNLFKQFGASGIQRLSSRPVGLFCTGSEQRRANARALRWLGQGPDLEAGPPQRPGTRWGLMVRGHAAGRAWSVLWQMSPEDPPALPGLQALPITEALEGPEGIYLWRRDD